MDPRFFAITSLNDAIIENIVKQHEKNLLESGKGSGELGADDIIDVLIKLEKKGGTETSATTVVWAMSEMMKHPRVFAKAQAEVREAFKGKEMLEEDDIEQLEYLKLVVKETLRCYPPIPLLIPRECREETVVCGYTIPQKARVLINVWAIGRDSKYWEDPENFIPERFENNNNNNNSIDFMGNHFEFLPFGAGRRICPGLAFGFANTVSPLAHLLYNFDWKLPAGVTVETLDMTERPGMAVSKKNELFLIPTLPVNSH
nr:premnaspirodiene oxygenase-like [Ipomoea batatas]